MASNTRQTTPAPNNTTAYYIKGDMNDLHWHSRMLGKGTQL